MQNQRKSGNNKSDKKKLTIEDFKTSVNAAKTQEALSKIVGGVLDSCHTTKPPTDEVSL
jgi:hypothetical protein